MAVGVRSIDVGRSRGTREREGVGARARWGEVRARQGEGDRAEDRSHESMARAGS